MSAGSEDRSRFVWMKVSDDEYELPVAVADSLAALARLCGVTEASIYSSMSKARHGIRKTLYRKVRIDLDDTE